MGGLESEVFGPSVRSLQELGHVWCRLRVYRCQAIQIAFELGLMKKVWNRDLWQKGYLPGEIEPFGSARFLVQLWVGLSRDSSKIMKYESDFYEKLVG